MVIGQRRFYKRQSIFDKLDWKTWVDDLILWCVCHPLFENASLYIPGLHLMAPTVRVPAALDDVELGGHPLRVSDPHVAKGDCLRSQVVAW